MSCLYKALSIHFKDSRLFISRGTAADTDTKIRIPLPAYPKDTAKSHLATLLAYALIILSLHFFPCLLSGVAHNAVESISVAGEDVLVLGCGPVGLFAIGVAKALGESRCLDLQQRETGCRETIVLSLSLEQVTFFPSSCSFNLWCFLPSFTH